jgi:predicted nucleotidyltransferase
VFYYSVISEREERCLSYLINDYPERVGREASMSTEVELKKRLPVRVVNSLLQIGERYQKKGIQLFIFGSFADSTNRQTSDLDIGVLWDDGRQARTFTSLYSDIQDLPTVRKIDLVDMEQVSEAFKKKVLASEVLFLSKRPIKA